MTLIDESKLDLKSVRREIKKRPRMKVHGASLKRPSKYAGKAIVRKKR